MRRYPTIADLRDRARKRIPHIAWEYLDSGTGSETALARNIEGMERITLVPRFMRGELKADMSTELFGQQYAAPFGIAPIGLGSLMWPRVERILAATAKVNSIPYCLSTVAGDAIETIGPIAGEMAWFQLYPPREPGLRADLIRRAREAGYRVMVVTVDVPIPSRRERVARAGLRMPPRITPRFVWDALHHPAWTVSTLKAGLPRLRTMEPYVHSKSMADVISFHEENMGGSLSWEYLKEVRDLWDGPLVAKGIHHPEDAERAVQIGFDGIQVSNHGARQFDATPAAIDLLAPIVCQVKGRAAILFDSGVRSGLDVLRAIAVGADFVMLGRAFIYGVAALGPRGGDHVIEILHAELRTSMGNLGYSTVRDMRGCATGE